MVKTFFIQKLTIQEFIVREMKVQNRDNSGLPSFEGPGVVSRNLKVLIKIGDVLSFNVKNCLSTPRKYTLTEKKN